jgi:hypothetical protein
MPQHETRWNMDESKMGKRSLDQMSRNNNNNAQATGDDPMVSKSRLTFSWKSTKYPHLFDHFSRTLCQRPSKEFRI